MPKEITVLMWAAATIGFFHTILGPDHYIPFIAMSKARKWSISKTAIITLLCGIGHILSSIVLGFIGIGLGTAVLKLESIESQRGELAGWLLLIFGFTYFVWGIHRAIRNKKHTHLHTHDDGTTHEHVHGHASEHVHVHETKKNITPWILFTIFVFGPCEPLIPILMYPAMAKGNIFHVSMVASVFAVATIGTMMTLVMFSSYSLKKISFSKLERYSHALAGFTIFFCGYAIKFLGL